MRYARPSLLALSFLIFPPPCILAQTDPRLSPELEILRPFLGDWVGEFQNSEERPPVLRSWKAALDGQAVREIRTVLKPRRFLYSRQPVKCCWKRIFR